MDYVQVIVLAIIQGIAEFLPISSSGHLNVIRDIFVAFGSTFEAEGLTLSIALHFGTLLSVLVVFWRRIWLLVTTDRRVFPLVVVATIPAVIVKLISGDKIDPVIESSLISGCCFPITGVILLWCSNSSGKTVCRELSWGRTILIGISQAFALLPGISRSGTTISAGLLCGLKRDEAATFSFLMAIPAIAGGAFLEIIKFAKKPETLTAHTQWLLVLGIVISFLVGVMALTLLMRWLQAGKLKYFSW